MEFDSSLVGSGMDSVDSKIKFVGLEIDLADLVDLGIDFMYLPMGSEDLGMNFIDSGRIFWGEGWVLWMVSIWVSFTIGNLDKWRGRYGRYVIWLIPENRHTEGRDLEWSPVSSWNGSIDSDGQSLLNDGQRMGFCALLTRSSSCSTRFSHNIDIGLLVSIVVPIVNGVTALPCYPLTYGDYPKNMCRLVGDRLPKFTTEQAAMVKSSYDFLGINYYTSYYASDMISPYKVNISYSSDSRVDLTRMSDANVTEIEHGVNDFQWVDFIHRHLLALNASLKSTHALIPITKNKS
ncbi:Beta-glucosidase 27 [Capsicum chinense]|nr:Beta-glucosidase 27 [Capsicum chinense]